ncbi:MAG: YjfI family protein [Oceanobacter sp.]
MAWDLEGITTLAKTQDGWSIEVEDHCLSISNDEGVDVFVYPGEQQLIAESLLFPQSSVRDIEALNALVMRTHQLVPLTTIGIKHIAGEDYYIAFGALSSDSKPSVVVEEIDTLFVNVGEFLDLYAEFLTHEEVSA